MSMADFRKQMHTSNPRNMGSNVILDIVSESLCKCENIENMPIGMAYVPWQQWKTVFDLDKALKVGTIFPELDLPFLGMRGEGL